MANKIKGITIEINGDVTKLKKALEGVESSAKKTTQELKQINQQLKYDLYASCRGHGSCHAAHLCSGSP